VTLDNASNSDGDHRTERLRQINFYCLHHARARPKTRVEGTSFFTARDLYSKTVDPAIVRRRVGMVPKLTPFPTTIGENVVVGLRLNGGATKKFLNERLEKSLHGCSLGRSEDDLHKPARAWRPTAKALHRARSPWSRK
jgi:ABC-type phosphate transport system ATPase subunit